MLNDENCILRCRSGDIEAFQPLVERYQKLVFSFLRRRLYNQHDAEEAAQESFCRAYMSLDKLQNPKSFYSWVLGIAERVAKEQIRNDRTLPLQEGMNPEDAEGTGRIQNSIPIAEALATLPEAYREMIRLRYFEGLSCKEVSQTMEMPIGSVTKGLSRAFQQLRQTLQAPASPVTTPGGGRNHGLQ